MTHSASVIAIIVTYHPNQNALQALCERLCPQVGSIVLVDNASGPFLADFLAAHQNERIHGISLAENTGVANALNVGMQWAEQAGASMVICFDQDSLPAADMVACLLAAHARLALAGVRVGALGPQQIDRRSQLPTPFIAASATNWQRVLPATGEVLAVDHLITSGCLIPLAVIAETGPMLAELFIDGVDLEWSWRCRAAGYHLYGVESAHLLHAIGDRIVFFFGRQLHLHSPSRQYYIVRNVLYLRRLAHAPATWRRICWRGLLMRMVFFSLFSAPRWKNCRLMFRGVRDGIGRRLGALAHEEECSKRA